MIALNEIAFLFRRMHMMIAFVVLSSFILEAQSTEDKDNVSPTSDSTTAEIQKKSSANKEFVMKKSPTFAWVSSFLLPGFGQFYVEDYLKGSGFAIAAGVLTGYYIHYNSSYLEKAKLVRDEEANNPESPDLDILKQSREVQRDNKDQTLLFLFGVCVLSAVDAYVGAHLYDFDVSDDLSLKIMPVASPYNVGLGISLIIK